jgi:hypothetical protein
MNYTIQPLRILLELALGSYFTHKGAMQNISQLPLAAMSIIHHHTFAIVVSVL